MSHSLIHAMDASSDAGHGEWRFSGDAVGAERPSESDSEGSMKRRKIEADAGRYAATRQDADSNDEEDCGSENESEGEERGRDDEEGGDFFHHLSEVRYRDLLAERLQHHRKKRLKEAIAARTTVASALMCKAERSRGDSSGDKQIWIHDKGEVNYSNHYTPKFEPDLNFPDQGDIGVGLVYQKEAVRMGVKKAGPGSLLDLGGGLKFEIPLYYDELAASLHLPSFASLQIEERIVYGRLKSMAFFSAMDSDPWSQSWRLQSETGESWRKAPLDNANQRALPPTMQKRFGLQVLDSNMRIPSSDSICEDFGGGSEAGSLEETSATVRQIATESGQLRLCEVKILETSDGYELVQRKVQKNEPLARDPKEVALEDEEKTFKYWINLVRKDLPKHHKSFLSYFKKLSQDVKRAAELCQREVKNRNVRSLKMMKAAPMRTRRLARDMIMFWKKWDKEQVELRRKEEKDAAEALKRDQELREAKRQQQRLNFLLTQTELYSHFMQNKMAGLTIQPSQLMTVETDATSSSPIGDVSGSHGQDAAEEAALKEEAFQAATLAVSQQVQRTSAFDNESSKLRQAAGAGGEVAAHDGGKTRDGVADIDLLNPSTMPTTSSVQQPKMFHGSLKEYQLKGLQWLVNCYEQGLNGILADEMGLGKTIQAMAFLGHLAEEKNIWGPFLVVAPASVLNNWADEVNRFCPDLRILPYWGAANERAVLRKNINPNRLYRREAGFHVLITSYQLLVSDEKYFKRVKWQYMVLDEAQAIKSASSQRWKTLLSFNCRNRLLLTGTPIQNSMAELWALLHFIMPTLFDSHEQFNEWFSKGIEGHAEHGGTLNEHQLTRLHSILKPFMLRRVKKDVITEMTNKKEVVVPCSLSSRQHALYRAIKNKISVADLFAGGQLNDKKVLNLMNIVIQLRKVCNHPELFERNEGQSSVHFATIPQSLLPPPFGELEDIYFAGACNPVSYKVPKLLYRDGMRCLPTDSSGSTQGFFEKWIRTNFNVFSPENVHSSSLGREEHVKSTAGLALSGAFGFIRLSNLSPPEVAFLATASSLEQCLFALLSSRVSPPSELHGPITMGSQGVQNSPDEGLHSGRGSLFLEVSGEEDEDSRIKAVQRLLMLPSRSESGFLRTKHPAGPLWQPFEALAVSPEERFLGSVGLLRSVRSFMPPVRAPQISVVCSDRGFVNQRTEELHSAWLKRMLVGFARTSEYSGPAVPRQSPCFFQADEVRGCSLQPLLALPFRIFGSAPALQSFDFAKMLTDSGKLQTLDVLLKRLRAQNHRVLLFAQMTKMLNILEDYMNYRKYKYLRLDGSSTIMDRRDMVKDFQHRSDIFVFLLSTRAGGLGINLTAADTVIFYESDWNPTMDLQAMDRAHRLGQTKEVTVYRLICKGTVEEKIVKRASQKNTVQQLVMTGGQSVQGDVLEAEEVVSLLLDDAELEARMREQNSKQVDKKGRRRKGWAVAGGLKGVRLDAEGGASLDDEILAAPVEVMNNGGDTSVTAEKGVTGNVPDEAMVSGNKRRRSLEMKPPKPPKVPRPARAPKVPKEPKSLKLAKPSRELKAMKEPRPPRDPRLPKTSRQSKKGTGPSESSTPLISTMANGPGDGYPLTSTTDLDQPLEETQDFGTNGDHISTLGLIDESDLLPADFADMPMQTSSTQVVKSSTGRGERGKGNGKQQASSSRMAEKLVQPSGPKKATEILAAGEESWSNTENVDFKPIPDKVGSLKLSLHKHHLHNPASENGSAMSVTFKDI